MFKLAVTKRDVKMNNDGIREEGNMPAVFYGQKIESTPVIVNQSEFKKILKEAGESSVVTLDMDGKGTDVLIHDVALNPVTDEPIHSDFLVIDKDKKVTVKIPLEFVGESNAVKMLGGTLVKVIHELEIEALPKDLPQSISVDLSALGNLDSHISVGDLKLPEGVESKSSVEEIVASVSVQKEEVEEEKPEADLADIKVEKKGKKEEIENEESPKEEGK